MKPILYQQNFVIPYQQLDPFGHLSPTAALQMAQSLATGHAEACNAGYNITRAAGCAWVIPRAQYQFFNMPEVNSQLVGTTWLGVGRHGFVPRYYTLQTAQGDLVMCGSGEWMLIDLSTGHTVSPQLSAQFEIPSNPQQKADHIPTPRRLRPKTYTQSIHRPVLYSDTDTNGHLNNCYYAAWVMDLLPKQLLAHTRLCTLKMNYVSQAMWEEEITLQYNIDNLNVQVCGSVGDKCVFLAEATLQEVQP